MSPKVFSLLQKHQRLDEELRIEQVRKWPDHFRIRRLKKLKLAVRDALRDVARPRNPTRA
ncbi:YdcH family protein [Croceibacterium aestuarii]|uniref:YdcH family protein n=1 Tax=Croceibacterium aestuarii TaxID=3064139 RepID=UPI00272DF902|nr:YdcH family protein [Croceibacterium sp. D39]